MGSSSEIQQAYTNAAEAYYQQALLALDANNTRTGAQQAYDYFAKADKIIPGIKM